MSINKIELPGFIIQHLFQNSLVDLSAVTEEQFVSASGELQFFGGNKQHIILLVNNSDVIFISDPQLTFLSGILNACNLNFEDVAILNVATYPDVSYKKISETFNARIIMLFGVTTDAIQLPFVIPEFQRQSYNNQLYLAVPSLHDIENNKEQKRKLWITLQQIFSL